MPRIKITPRFDKARSRLDSVVADAVDRALVNLMERPELRGLNFEPLAGRPGFFTIRANLNFRILLRKMDDAEGTNYAVEDVDKHDIYKRRR
jgi:hypothetical protein